MEVASYQHCLFFLFSVHLLLPPLSHGLGLPLRQGWSFSADLSDSSPLPRNAFSPLSSSLFTPILSSSNFFSAKGFAVGFLTLFPASSPSPTGIFLTICLGTNTTNSQGMAYAIPVWNWAKERPLKQLGSSGKVSLHVEESETERVSASGGSDLVLRDGDGSEAWRVENVVAMELQENGNWVFYNSENEVAWQSFEHPTDTLLQGQKLYVGKKIVSSNSLYVMEMKPGGLLIYMESQAPSPLYYWGFPVNSTGLVEYLAMHALDLSSTPPVNLTAAFLSYACPGSTQPYAALMGKNLTIEGGCARSQWPSFINAIDNITYSSDFMRLSDDGLIEGYTYFHNNGQNLLISAQSGASSCLPPNACGPYGICTSFLFGSKRSCHCPSVEDNALLSNVFNPINPSDVSQGCARARPLQCHAHVNTTLLEIKRTSITSVHLLYETNYKSNTHPLEECIALCASNCSCAGFIYHTGTSFCFPFSDTGGLSNVTFIDIDTVGFSVYVKVLSTSSSYSGEANSHEPHSISTTLPAHGNHSKHSRFKPILYALSTATATLLVGLGILCVTRYRRHVGTRKGSLDMDSDVCGEEDSHEVFSMLPIRYSCKELHEATGGFKTLLGSGAHGCVYKGVLRDGRMVAVKKLDQVSPRRKQFLAEVATMGGISHYNIVHLYGFCSQKSKRLLVYEYMENGSLDQWLFSQSRDRLLSWLTRFDIAVGTARGLTYLHGDCPQPIIHFDVKPQNILLDKSFVPKLSDFGLSKLVERESSFVMTGVRGTPGYLAPEWLSNSAVTKKCDVYSYGMVLLELVSGRRNAIQSLAGSDEWYFPTWAATRCQQGKVLELVDKRLEGSFDEEQVKVMVHVAFLCIQKEPNLRPTMGAVCKMLEGVVPLGEEAPYSTAFIEEPLSPETVFSLASCSTLKEGR